MTPRSFVVRGAVLVLAAVLVVTLAARGLAPVPDFVAIAVAAFAVRGGPRVGLAVGLLGGWCLDLLPPGAFILGLSALAYAVAGVVVGRFRRFGPIPWVVVAGQVLLVTVLVDAVSIGSSLLRGGAVEVSGLVLRWLATATLGLLLGPALVRLDAWADVHAPRARR